MSYILCIFLAWDKKCSPVTRISLCFLPRQPVSVCVTAVKSIGRVETRLSIQIIQIRAPQAAAADYVTESGPASVGDRRFVDGEVVRVGSSQLTKHANGIPPSEILVPLDRKPLEAPLPPSSGTLRLSGWKKNTSV